MFLSIFQIKAHGISFEPAAQLITKVDHHLNLADFTVLSLCVLPLYPKVFSALCFPKVQAYLAFSWGTW